MRPLALSLLLVAACGGVPGPAPNHDAGSFDDLPRPTDGGTLAYTVCDWNVEWDDLRTCIVGADCPIVVSGGTRTGVCMRCTATAGEIRCAPQ